MMEREVFLGYLILVALAEVVTTFGNPVHGLLLHTAVLASMLVLSALKYGENTASGFFLSLSLAPLVRVVSLSLPLAGFPRYSWYLLAGATILSAALASMRVTGLRPSDVGVNLGRPCLQLAVAATGVPLGVVEYLILQSEPLVVGFGFWELLLLGLAILFFTGFVEELVFRGIIQRAAVASLGGKAGVLGGATLFAVLHIGWLSLLDFLFVYLVGLFFGFITYRSGSIVGVSAAHGLTNVLLFLVLPPLSL